MIDLLVKNGSVVTPDATLAADVAVTDGKITGVGVWGAFQGAKEEIDARGKLVLPGLVDPHVHIAHPFKDGVSQDDFFTATCSAAHGGTTALIDFAIQWDKNTSLADSILARINQADGEAVVDYALHACPTLSTQETLDAVPGVIASGVPSFKIYMIYRKQGRMVDDAILYGMLRGVTARGGILGVHAENAPIAEFNEEAFLRQGRKGPEYFPLSKPNMVEAECIHRALYLNHCAKGRLYIFHLSTAEGLRMVRDARAKGEQVFAETCPHYLTLTQEVYKRPDGANYICSPPLRSQSDIDALWSGISDGTISAIGSDHCGFGKAQKATGQGDFSRTPNGLPGIETRLPVIYTQGVSRGRIDVNRMVDVMSTGPAKIFGLYPQKGAIQPGSDGDLVVFDPDDDWILCSDALNSPVDWTPYEGMRVHGSVNMTVSGGRIIVQEGRFLGRKGGGRFLERRLENR